MTARTQSRGRGRNGRRWRSPVGGLWLSVIIRPKIGPELVGTLQLYAAVSVQKAVETVTGLRLGLKWPNDLVLVDRKLGGILVKAKIVGESMSYAILGIGLNVNIKKHHLPKVSTSVWEAKGRTVEIPRLLRAVVQTLRANYPLVRNPKNLADMWWAGCAHRAKRVRVSSDNSSVSGRTHGIGPDGSLLVKTAKGRVVHVSEGTLRVLEN